MAFLLRDVRSQGQSGKHLLALSFSGFDPERTFLDLVIWNSSSSHYKVALQTLEESVCGECRCERPADRAVGAECAGAGVVCTENLIRVDDVMESPKLAE
jgi:hypothetical protein